MLLDISVIAHINAKCSSSSNSSSSNSRSSYNKVHRRNDEVIAEGSDYM